MLKVVYEVITIGSATVDVFANTDSQLVKLITPKGEEDFITYPSGSKILIKDIDFLIGGGGTNTAVSFSRLGLRTAFLGKIGIDENSEKIKKLLEKENVKFIGAQEGQTGYSIILDSIEHDRTILTFKGSNNKLQQKDVDLSFLKTKWIYSSSMIGESFETLKNIFEYAHNHGVKIAFNPSEYQVKKGLSSLSQIISLVDVLVMNLEEANLLFETNKKAKDLIMFFSDYPEKYFLITDGANGITTYHNNKIYTLKPSSKVKIVETTGAGDAFASGFLAGLIKNLSFEDSLKLGFVQSESVISSYGAKEKLLTMEEARTKVSEFDGELRKELVDKSNHSIKEHNLPSFKISSKEEGFHLSDGRTIRSIQELGYLLKFTPNDKLEHHVGVGFNHFADWIEHVFKEEKLAKLIREKDNIMEIGNCLLDFTIPRTKNFK